MWCSGCQEHANEDHYENDQHKVGVEFGPLGYDLALHRLVRAFVYSDLPREAYADAFAAKVMALDKQLDEAGY